MDNSQNGDARRGKPRLNGEWEQYAREVGGVSSGRGTWNSFLDGLERRANLEQRASLVVVQSKHFNNWLQGRELGGDTSEEDSDEAESDSDEEMDDDESDDDEEEENHDDDADDAAAAAYDAVARTMTSDQIWARAANPENLLGPLPGTIGGEQYASDGESDDGTCAESGSVQSSDDGEDDEMLDIGSGVASASAGTQGRYWLRSNKKEQAAVSRSNCRRLVRRQSKEYRRNE